MKKPKQFHHFEKYLIEKWLPEKQRQGEPPEKFPVLAYKNCYHVIRHTKVVSRNTLRKWFGIEESILPKREQIIRLAFAAQFTVEELQEYLQEGILAPGIQINDYREVIFMYGLEHRCSYQDCLDMITLFERYVNQDTVILQRTHTEQLRELYQASHSLEPEAFLVWMCDHAQYFKGYSRVALKHFVELKTEIVEYVREDAEEELKGQLRELGYYEWARKKKLKEDDKGNIQEYIHNISRRKNSAMYVGQKKEISDLIRIAYMKKQTNRYFVRSIYNQTGMNANKSQKYEKILSQLLRTAEHKEKEIKLSWAYSCLGGIEDKKASCPQWLCAMMTHYGFPARQTVEEMEVELKKRLEDQRQCCHLVRREDLLLMLHYIAYLHYERKIKKRIYEYNQQEAKNEFIKYANKILSECQMAEMNAGYYMDYILLSSYTETGMNLFWDLIEEWEEESDSR